MNDKKMSDSCCSSLCHSMMSCMENNQWCAWGVAIAGVVLLLLGVILSATAVKVLWVIISILITLAGAWYVYKRYDADKSKD